MKRNRFVIGKYSGEIVDTVPLKYLIWYYFRYQWNSDPITEDIKIHFRTVFGKDWKQKIIQYSDYQMAKQKYNRINKKVKNKKVKNKKVKNPRFLIGTYKDICADSVPSAYLRSYFSESTDRKDPILPEIERVLKLRSNPTPPKNTPPKNKKTKYKKQKRKPNYGIQGKDYEPRIKPRVKNS